LIFLLAAWGIFVLCYLGDFLLDKCFGGPAIKVTAYGAVPAHSAEHEKEFAPYGIGTGIVSHTARGFTVTASGAIAIYIGIAYISIRIRGCFEVHVRCGEALDEIQSLQAVVSGVEIKCVFHVTSPC